VLRCLTLASKIVTILFLRFGQSFLPHLAFVIGLGSDVQSNFYMDKYGCEEELSSLILSAKFLYKFYRYEFFNTS